MPWNQGLHEGDKQKTCKMESMKLRTIDSKIIEQIITAHECYQAKETEIRNQFETSRTENAAALGRLVAIFMADNNESCPDGICDFEGLDQEIVLRQLPTAESGSNSQENPA